MGKNRELVRFFIKGIADGNAATIKKRLAHEIRVVYLIDDPFSFNSDYGFWLDIAVEKGG